MPLALVVGLAILIVATTPERPPLEWVKARGPEGSVNLDSLVAAGDGFAALSGMTVDGIRLWSSPDGAEWSSQILQGAPSQLAPVDEGLVAYGVRSGRIVGWDGSLWSEDGREIVFPDEIRSRQGSGRPGLIDAGVGLVVMSILGDVWWTSDGAEFDLAVSEPEWGRGAQVEVPFDSACRAPVVTSPDVPPMTRTESGLVALNSSNPEEPFGIWPVCEPSAWRSEDGRTWSETGTAFGDGSFVYGMTWRDGRYTAVGGRGIGKPSVWTSTDGERWTTIDTFTSLEGIDLHTVEAGPAGWIILGRDSGGAGTIGWTSRDGLCWLALPWQINGVDAAVGAKQVMVIDRATYPDIWVGTVTGGLGSC